MKFDKTAKFKIYSSCISTSIDEKSIILNVENGKYYELNQTASTIWNCLKKDYIFENIQKKLTEEFDVEEDVAEKSLNKFLVSCLNYEFLKKI
tara:strand:+ start:160 stop:438 length:279 start_codon:yes stop_codon:yes gene_type:complete